MKNLRILLFKCTIGLAFIGGMIGTPVYSQSVFPLDEKGEIVYSEVVKVDSIKSNELYVRAHEWFANTFKSAKAVIQLDDKEAGKIIGKGDIEADIINHQTGLMKYSVGGLIYFTVEIQTKDGKYKYSFSNLIRKNENDYEIDFMTIPASTPMPGLYPKQLDRDRKFYSDVRNDMNKKILNIIDGLKKSMNTNTNNW